MARRSLRPHLNQIRTWVQQGRTDAWIAHQLEVTVQQIDAFKRENELAPDAQVEGNGTPVDFDDEIDLRAQDDELIAAELEKAEPSAPPARPRRPRRRPPRPPAAPRPARTRRTPRPPPPPPRAPWRAHPPAHEGHRARGHLRPRRRGLRAVAGPAVADDPVYAEHWAGHRPVTVTVEEDQIVIRRAGDDALAGDDEPQ
jgi:hypothetical protein